MPFFQSREAARSNCYCCVCARGHRVDPVRVRYYVLCRWFDDSFGTDNSALCIPFQCPAHQCSQYSHLSASNLFTRQSHFNDKSRQIDVFICPLNCRNHLARRRLKSTPLEIETSRLAKCKQDQVRLCAHALDVLDWNQFKNNQNRCLRPS